MKHSPHQVTQAVTDLYKHETGRAVLAAMLALKKAGLHRLDNVNRPKALLLIEAMSQEWPHSVSSSISAVLGQV